MAQNRKITPLNLVSQLIGYAVGFYLGLNVVVPLIGAGLCFWGLKEWDFRGTLSKEQRGLISILAGHAVWMTIPVLMNPYFLAIVGLDLVWMWGGAFAMVRWPKSQRLMWGLCVVQVLSIGWNFHTMTSGIGVFYDKAMLTHIMLRILFVGLAAWVMYQDRRTPKNPSNLPKESEKLAS